MKLKFKLVTGKFEEVEISPESTVEALRDILIERTGYNKNSMRIALLVDKKGSFLEDANTIESYNLNEDSQLFVALNTRGG